MWAQQLEFDFEFGCSLVDAEYYRDGARDLIQRLVPADLLEARGLNLASQRARFADLLPMITWSDLSRAPCTLSVLLLCKYRLNACNFFYDMISRWLLPQKRVNVELFFASDVRLPHLSEEVLSVAEIVIHLKSAQDVEEVRRNLSVIEMEIRLGVVSNYHARRILEFKGLSADGKTAMVQEKIGSLIQSHSKDFDRGIFAQMQQFLVNCREEFKKARDYHHISRMISNLYSIRKFLQQNVASSPSKRHVLLKFLKTRVQYTSDSSKVLREKPVLGILAGISFLKEYELFESDHLFSAIQKYFPSVRLVTDSPFIDKEAGGPFQILYLEIEKVNGADFTLDEIQVLRAELAEQMKASVERLTHPIFMPRNEEEVLRNIMTLSRQLRYVNDLPQIILSLDEHKGDDLCFTVILVRSVLDGATSLADLFSSVKTGLKVFTERVRCMGRLRGRYTKEAVVLRAFVKSEAFLREDRSVDFYKARDYALKEISRVVGEMRDFNGGMLLKQNQLLSSLKTSLGKLSDAQNLLIEKFFYSLFPIEMRAVLDSEPLKQMFLMLLQAKKSDLLQKKSDARKAIAITPVYDAEMKKHLLDNLNAFSVASHRLVSFQLELGDVPFLGYLLFSDDKEQQEQFLSLFDCPQDA